MTQFFYNLTKRNWGAPWHILLAFLGVNLFEAVFPYLIWQLFELSFHLVWVAVLGFFVVNAIGYIYELIQGKQADTREDLLCNLAGTILGVLL